MATGSKPATSRLAISTVDAKLRNDPAHLVAVLNGEVPPDGDGWLSAENALTCLWSVALQPGKADAVQAAGAIPQLVTQLQKGSPGRISARPGEPAQGRLPSKGAKYRLPNREFAIR